MALVTCPDCGTQVSEAAPACIKCGRPMRGTPAPRAIPAAAPAQAPAKTGCGTKAVGCFVVLVILSALGRAARPPEGREHPPSAPAPVVAVEEPKDTGTLLPGEKGVLRSSSGGLVAVAVSEEAYEKFLQTLHDNDDVGLRQLLAAGVVAQVPDGTRVLALSGGPGVFSGLRKVRILDGENAGHEVVVAYEFLKR